MKIKCKCGKEFSNKKSFSNHTRRCLGSVEKKYTSLTHPLTQKRFWKYVAKTSTCWVWTGSIKKDGYGELSGGMGRKMISPHRYSYELLIGNIPQGKQIDHLCRNRCCVNPKHLEVVSQKENILRGIVPTAINAKKKMCVNGHPFDSINTRITKSGNRLCVKCSRSYYWNNKKIQCV